MAMNDNMKCDENWATHLFCCKSDPIFFSSQNGVRSRTPHTHHEVNIERYINIIRTSSIYVSTHLLFGVELCSHTAFGFCDVGLYDGGGDSSGDNDDMCMCSSNTLVTTVNVATQMKSPNHLIPLISFGMISVHDTWMAK